MADINIHHVRKIVKTQPQELGNGFVRRIKIESKGEYLEIVLFSDDLDSIAILEELE